MGIAIPGDSSLIYTGEKWSIGVGIDFQPWCTFYFASSRAFFLALLIYTYTFQNMREYSTAAAFIPYSLLNVRFPMHYTPVESWFFFLKNFLDRESFFVRASRCAENGKIFQRIGERSFVPAYCSSADWNACGFRVVFSIYRDFVVYICMNIRCI